jgi:hypothetical protein
MAGTVTLEFTDIYPKTFIVFTLHFFHSLFAIWRSLRRKFWHFWRWLLWNFFVAFGDSVVWWRTSSIYWDVKWLFSLVDTLIYWIHWCLCNKSGLCKGLWSELLRGSGLIGLIGRHGTFLQSSSLVHDLTQLLLELCQVGCHFVKPGVSLSAIGWSWGAWSVNFIVDLSLGLVGWDSLRVWIGAEGDCWIFVELDVKIRLFEVSIKIWRWEVALRLVEFGWLWVRGKRHILFYLSLVFILLVQDNMVDFNFVFRRSS